MGKVDKSNIRDLLPLTAAQEGMLFHYRLFPGALEYLEQLYLELSGPLCPDRFREVWVLLTEAHDVLRTEFRWEELTRPVQVILKRSEPDIRETDLSDLPEGEIAAGLATARLHDAREGFDLERPPFRVSLVRLGKERWGCLISYHHILFDGWSNSLLLEDFFMVYGALSRGETPLIPQRNGFRSFISAINTQEALLAGEFWRRYLEGMPEPPMLGISGKRPAAPQDVGRLEMPLPSETAGRLEGFVRRYKVTPAAVYYTAWGLLLHLYNHSGDVLFGTAVSGRRADIPGIEKMLGLFINTLPLRVEARDSDSAYDVLMRVHRHLLAREEFQHTPLTETRAAWSGAGADSAAGMRVSGWFDTLLVLENYPLDKALLMASAPLRVISYEMTERTDYPLSLGITTGEAAALHAVYNPSLLERSRVWRLLEHFIMFLDELIANPRGEIRHLGFSTAAPEMAGMMAAALTAQEERVNPGRWTLHYLFEARAASIPDVTALVSGDFQMSFRELQRRSQRTALRLRAMGVGAGDIVALRLEHGPELAPLLLGILKTGAAYLPLDVSLPDHRLHYILTDSAAKILLEGELLREALDGGADPVGGTEEGDDVYGPESVNALSAVYAAAAAYVIYTSGTTGKPRGVVIHHDSAVNTVRYFGVCYGLKPGVQTILLSGYSFDASVDQIFGALLFGALLHVPPRTLILDIPLLYEYLVSRCINVINFTPTYLAELLGRRDKAASLHYVICGAEALEKKVLDGLLKKGYRVFNHYGPTETTVDALTGECRAGEPVTLGKPLPNTFAVILDHWRRPVPPGAPGELYLGGAGVGAGYLNNPETTADKFVFLPHLKSLFPAARGGVYFKTGDRVKLTDDGRFIFLGRLDRQIKIRGFRIEPEEIEAILLKYPGVRGALAVAERRGSGEDGLCAYLETSNPLAEEELVRFMALYLPPYMTPSAFICLETFPRTSGGKIDRSALPEPVYRRRGASAEPEDVLEYNIRLLWAEVLKTVPERIDVSADFFRSGGHSLRMAALAARMEKFFGKRIALMDLYQHPTIRGMAALLRETGEAPHRAVPLAERRDYYPLSPAQRRLYLLQMLEPRNVAYHITGVVRLEGRPDVGKIQEVFRGLVERHESLRTYFQEVDGEPVQRVAPQALFLLREWPAMGGSMSAPVITAEFVRPFDLDRPPLFRAALALRDERNALLMVDMHHIISDGLSVAVLIREFMDLYAGRSLPPLNLCYCDYVMHFRREQRAGGLKKAGEYWLSRLKGPLPVLDLHTDFPRPAVRQFAGSGFTVYLGSERSRELRQWADRLGIELFPLLLALFYILLARLTGQDDIIVGTPVSGRTHPDVHRLVGLFVNTLPLRTHPLDVKTFGEFAGETRRRVVEGLQHQDFPLEEIVDAVAAQRDFSRNPLFDVMFGLQNPDTPKFEIPGLKGELLPPESATAKCDLSMMATLVEGDLRWDVEFSASLFRRETVEGYIHYFQNIIAAALREPEGKIGGYSLLDEEDRRLVLEIFNRPSSSYVPGMTLSRMFRSRAARLADVVALEGATGQYLTYGALERRVTVIAGALRRQGIGGKSGAPLAAVQLERGFDMVASLLAIMERGAAYLPVDPEFPRRRVDYMIADSGAALTITAEWLSALPGEDSPDFAGMAPLPKAGEDAGEIIDDAGRPAYVLYTSGSTGRPKGVVVTGRSMMNLLEALQDLFPSGPGDAFLLKTPFIFDVSVPELFGFILGGTRLAVAGVHDHRDPAALIRLIRRGRVTHINFVPSMFNHFTDRLTPMNISELNSLKYIFLAGEALLPEQAVKFRRLSSEIQLVNLYGPTEATVYATFFSLSHWHGAGHIAIGKPMANTRIYILDKGNRLLPPGIPGELCIAGVGTAEGYLNNPELTARCFFDWTAPGAVMAEEGAGACEGERLYRTGDLACLDPEGDIRFLGRIDTQVKIRGYRIELSEIENQLMRHPEIHEAAATVWSGGEADGEAILCAYYIGDGEKVPSAAELRAYLSRELPDYMVPAWFFPITEIPLTPGGKLDKGALPSIREARQRAESPGVAPRTVQEKELARIWAEELSLETVGVDRTFFELGGDSFAVMRLSNRVRRDLGVEIPVATLFRFPTIKKLARYLESLQERAEDPLDMREREEGRAVSTMSLADGRRQEGERGVAVVGMALRFPGADDKEAFWRNLQDGICSVSFFSREELMAAGVPEEAALDPAYVGAKGIVGDIESFDAYFFEYTPYQAARLDPQQRLFHTVCHEALEDAGLDPRRPGGRVGLFAGAGENLRWLIRQLGSARDGAEQYDIMSLNGASFAPLTAYKLNLTGPAITINTACSTSLAAVDAACRALNDGLCDAALAGGVYISLPHKAGYMYREGMIMSSDGVCRAFSDDAGGTVGGEGAGVVVLKPLAAALRDKDVIYAVIRGSAVNNDGVRKAGYTAPSVEGQAEVICDAWSRSGIDPATVSYIETHGAGTALGDPVELAGLLLAYRQAGQAPVGSFTEKSVAIGSVKTNIGHLDAAAGAAGLIKTVLALYHGVIPPSLFFKAPNQKCDFAGSPFYVADKAIPWRASAGEPLRAGVSSFGIGGTNVHVVLESFTGAGAPEGEREECRDTHLLVISAKTPEALNRSVSRLSRRLEAGGDISTADVAFTLAEGRSVYPCRRFVAARDVAEAARRLNDPAFGGEAVSCPDMDNTRRLVFMFPGQGAQYIHMGRELHRREPIFREALDRCLELLKSNFPGEPVEWLFPAAAEPEAAQRLTQTRYAQPLLFAVEYALARLLLNWGFAPGLMIGHSIGEYTAACIAGVFSLEDALMLVSRRGEAMWGAEPGLMLSVPLPEVRLTEEMAILGAQGFPLDLAAVNSASQCVAAGAAEAVEALRKRLAEQGLTCRLLHTSHAFHSALMEPAAGVFRSAFAGLTLHAPQIPFISNVTGRPITDAEATDPEYWVRHMRQPVRFADGVSAIVEKSPAFFLEAGPGNTLSVLVRRHDAVAHNPAFAPVSLMRPFGESRDDLEYLLEAVGKLWLKGLPLSRRPFITGTGGRKISLPGYPLEPIRFPVDDRMFHRLPIIAGTGERGASAEKPQAAGTGDMSQWFWRPRWRQYVSPSPPASDPVGVLSAVLVFTRVHPETEAVMQTLAAEYGEVIRVEPGEFFQAAGKTGFIVNPLEQADFVRLVKALRERERLPERVVFLWSLDPDFWRESFQGLLHFAAAAPGDWELALDVLTAGLHDIAGSETVDYRSAPVMGLLKVMGQERPGISGRATDIIVTEPFGAGRPGAWAKPFLAELRRPGRGKEIAIRGRNTWIREFHPLKLPLPASGESLLREKGVYWLIGGLGEMGRRLALHLARTRRARLILTQRAPLTTDSREKLRPLEQEILSLGGSVRMTSVNASDYAAMEGAAQDITATEGEIHGIFLLAGSTHPSAFSPLETTSAELIERHFSAKVFSLPVLRGLLANRQPDFVVFMSSISAILGGLGFAAYAAANSVLDYFAHDAGREGRFPWIAINWDGWRFSDGDELSRAGGESPFPDAVRGISPEEGLACLERILTVSAPWRPEGHIVQSASALEQRLNKWVYGLWDEKPGSGSGEGAPAAGAPLGRTGLSNPFVPPADELEERLTDAWDRFFGVKGSGVTDDFYEMGGDSLKAVTLSAWLRKELNIDAPISRIFTTPTIRGLAQYIREQAADAGTPAIPSAPEQEYYPLTPAQDRIFLAHSADPGGVAYNLPLAAAITGNPDREKFREIFLRLIRRHEPLRTSFHVLDGRVVQRVWPTAPFILENPVIPETQAGTALNFMAPEGGLSPEPAAQLARSFIRPFDLGAAPLLRVGLLETGAGTHLLMLDMHHIISDGVSLALLLEEMMMLYRGETPSPVRLQYRDYACWLQQEPQQRLLSRQESYWLEQFRAPAPEASLPLDYPRPISRTYRGAVIPFRVNPEWTARLNRLAAAHESSLFSLLLAAWSLLLHRLSGGDDIVVGVASAGRRFAELQNMLGMFVNTLPLRSFPNPEMTFAEFFRQVKTRVMDALENQDYPFQQLVEKVAPPRRPGRNPLFDTALILQNVKRPEIEIHGLKLTPLEIHNYSSKFDLTLEIAPDENGLGGILEYSCELFRAETAQRLAGYFMALLAAAEQAPEGKLGDLDYIPEREKKKLLEDFNANGRELPEEETIVTLFQRWALLHPGYTAVADGERRLSYGELDRLSDLFAQGLCRELGRHSNARSGPEGGAFFVAVILERSPELIVALLGALKAGGAYIPIDPSYPEERIRYMLSDSQADIVIRWREYQRLLTCPEGAPDVSAPLLFPRPGDYSVGEIVNVIYTSGSTGRPKGVAVSRRGLLCLAEHLREICGAAPRFRFSQTASQAFDAFGCECWGALTLGAALHIAPEDIRPHPGKMKEWLIREKIEVSFQSTPMAEQLLGADWRETGKTVSLRALFTGGDRLNRYPAAGLPFRFYNEYGPTEDSVCTTSILLESAGEGGEPREREALAPPIGKPILNHAVYILDRRLNPVPVNTPGEIYIGGAGLALGYLNRPELTRERFIELPEHDPRRKKGLPARLYRSGDLAAWLPDGNIRFIGRLDDQVKIRGFRIETGEIENRLMAHPGVGEAVATVRGDEGADALLCAYFTPADPVAPPSVSDLKEFLGCFLPGYMIPARLMMLDHFPLTANGKIDRRGLPEPERFLPGEALAPDTPVLRELARLWERLLNLPPHSVGRHDDFFILGGHSLKAALLGDMIEKEFGARLAPHELFNHSRLESQGALLEKKATSPETSCERPFPPILAQEKREFYLLTPAQQRLFLLSEMERVSTAYNMPVVLKLTGRVDKERLQRVFSALVQRHDCFRTACVTVDDVPVQIVRDKVDFRMEWADPDGPSILETFIRPFDLGRAPLLRAALQPAARRPGSATDTAILMMDMHHIISDGYSAGLLVREFMELYSGRELPSVPLTCADYAAWLGSPAYREIMAEQRRYWLELFQGELPLLDLPCDYPRPPLQSFAGGAIVSVLSPEIAAPLRRWAADNGATLFMASLALFYIFLYKLSGQEDIIIGTPVAARRHPRLRDMAGMCVNTLALRNTISGNQDANQLLAGIRALTISALANQEFPFGELAESIQASRDAGRNPLFDVMLSFQNHDIPRLEIPGLAIAPITLELHIAKFDLTLDISEQDGEMILTWEYGTALFREETVRRFIRYFEQLAAGVPFHPGRAVDSLSIITPAERQEVLERFNRPTEEGVFRGRTFFGVFEEQARRTPGVEAAAAESLILPAAGSSGMASISYDFLRRVSRRLARRLRLMGVKPGVIAPIMAGRSLEMIAAVLGVMEAGGAWLPVDPSYPQDRIDYILKDSACRLLLISCDITPPASFQGEIMDFSDPALYHNSQSPEEDEPLELYCEPEDPAYVIYTSGSTGRPKGVAVEHRQYMAVAGAWRKEYRLDAIPVRLLQMASFSFDVFAGDLARALLNGGKMTICPSGVRTNPAALHRLMTEHRITLFESAPALIIPFMDYIHEQQLLLPDLQLLILGSDVCRNSDFRTLLLRFGSAMRIINSYGVTEAAVDSGYYETSAAELAPVAGNVSIGKPLPDAQYFICDRGGNLQPPGIAGELYIGGPGTARGYLNQPELTAERFMMLDVGGGSVVSSSSGEPALRRVYRTGDLARWRPGGDVDFLGRTDFQVKIRGFRIETGEIESLLMRLFNLRAALALVRAAVDGEKYLCAYLVPAPGDEAPEAEALRERLAEFLPEYMIPAYFIPIPALPLSANGKVDRNALPPPSGSPRHNFLPPENALEESLIRLWSGVIGAVGPGAGSISCGDNFFHIGGHSLKASILISRIHKEWGVRLQLADMFRFPTIRGMAELMRNAEKEKFQAVEPVERREYYPLSPSQKRLYILHHGETAHVAYNITFAAILEGALDQPRLEEAFRLLIERHEAFRTCFRTVANAPVQVICAAAETPFAIERLTCPDDAASIQNHLREFIRPFDITRAPLLRVGLMALAPDKNLLAVDLDHIIGDGASDAVLIRDFLDFYRQRRLPSLTVQYRDYAVWLEKHAHSPRMLRQKRFWLERFTPPPEPADMPLDFPRPEYHRRLGDNVFFTFEPELTRRIRHMAEKNGVTVYILLLTLFYLLLSRLCGQWDIVIGAPSANRRHADLQDIIGMFVSTLPLRCAPEPGKNALEILAEIHRDTIRAFDNQEYPFEELVENLGLSRHSSRNPLFDVFFAYQDMKDTQPVHIPGLTLTPFPFHKEHAAFELILLAFEDQERMSMVFLFDTGIYKSETLERFARYYREIAVAVLDNPSVRPEGIALSHDLADPGGVTFADADGDFEF